MSTTIDQKVVEMQFDNRHFERNVETSISSLDKLKQSLNMTGASKGLEDVNAAAGRVNMSGLGSAVEAVQAKFSALQVMGVTALANITNSAVNAGKRIVSALTIDPIKTGFSEYETKINAVQTIMSNTASKGKTMEDVTKVLNELNTYADKTIYNFAEMTRNIGTFTAAGVGLEESATAIQGIANLAAMSGSTSQQASTAMYQLSQAMASGTVKLMDWNSVVNAGMGGELFQNALKETAKAHGTNVDALVEKYGSFRESLTSGWITTEVLTETLRKMTKSGAAEYLSELTGVGKDQITAAQEMVANNKDGTASYEALAEQLAKTGKISKENAIDMLKMADNAEDAATKVKTFTQLWDTLKESAQSGWSQTWEILVGDFEEAKETLTKFSDVIGKIIGDSAEARNKVLQGWKDAGGRADLVDSLFNIFEAAMSVAKPIKEAFDEIFPPITVKQLVGFTKGLKDLTAKMKLSETTANNLKRTFKGIFAVFNIAKQIISAVFKAVGSLFGAVGDLGGGILSVTGTIGDWLVALSKGIGKTDIFNKVLQGVVKVIKFVISALGDLVGVVGNIFGATVEIASSFASGVKSVMNSAGEAIGESRFANIFLKIWAGVKKVLSSIIDIISALGRSIANMFSNGGFQNLLEMVETLIAGGVGVGLMKFFKSLTGTVDGITDAIGSLGGVADIFDGLRGCLEAYQTKLKADALIKIATAIAILVGSVLVLSFIDSEKLYDSIMAITLLFGGLMGAIAVMSKASGDFTGGGKIAAVMMGVGLAVLLMASALKMISDIDIGKMATGLLGIAGLTTIVVIAAKALGKCGKSVIKGATQMVIFAAAIKILASACIDLAGLDFGQMMSGLLGVGILMAEIGLFLAATKNFKLSLKTAIGLVALAAAIKILASACGDFAKMKTGDMLQGVSAIGLILAEMAIFTKLTGNAKKVISTGIALIAIAAAMKIFASATKDLASLTWEGIAKGMVGMAGALLTVALTLKAMPKNLVSTGVGLVIVASALLILSNALGSMGGMSWESVGKGLLVLASSMLILSLALNAMKKTLPGSAALIVTSVALTILASALNKLGDMSAGAIVKSLLALAVAFTIIGVAGKVLAPVVPIILKLGAAMALIGIGVLALGVGLTVAAAGITAFAAALVASATSIVAGITVIIVGIIDLIPSILAALGRGIVALCQILTDALPAIGGVLKALVLLLIDVLVECIPPLADGLLKMLVGVLDALASHTPALVAALFTFVIGLIRSLAKYIPDFIVAIFELIGSVFQGVIDALAKMDFNVLVGGLAGIGLIAAIMVACSALLPLVPSALAGIAGVSLIIAEIGLLLAAIGAIAQIPGLKWLMEEGGEFLRLIGAAIGKFIGGIFGGVAGGFASSVTSELPKMAKDLSDFMTNLQPFLDGMKQLGPTNIFDGLASLTGKKASLADLGEDLDVLGPCLRRYSDSVKDVNAEKIKESAEAVGYIAKATRYISFGDGDISVFGTELIELGRGLADFSISVADVKPEAVTAAAEAAKVLAEMTSCIPNSGGVAAWFAGDNSVAAFGEELVKLGEGLKGFSDNISGVEPTAITAAAEAARTLAEMTQCIPNEGGMSSWFAGDNSISNFGDDLSALGAGLKGFADEFGDTSPESLTAAAGAAKALAEMTQCIPNEGGMSSWFAGDNSIAVFAENLVALGEGLAGFSVATSGVNPEAVTAAAGAAKVLAEMTTYIPNTGGMVSWFTGDNSVSRFATDLVALGQGLAGFSVATSGINIEATTAAANAAKVLAEMTTHIPNTGGMVSWFAGDVSVSKFATDLVSLGQGLAGFSAATAGVNAETMVAAANAAKTLAEMTTYIPNTGGMVTWFAGDNSVAIFAADLVALGEGLAGFSVATAGVNPEAVTAAANSAKALAEMTAYVPNSGGMASWFTGEASISKFGGELINLGQGLAGFSSAVVGIDPEAVTAAANAAKALAEMTDSIPKSGGIASWFSGENSMSSFGSNLKDFGSALKDYSDEVSGINTSALSASTSEFNKLVDMARGTSGVDFGGMKSFGDSLGSIGKSGVDSFIEAFKNASDKASEAGKNFIDALVKAVKAEAKTVSSAFTEVVDKASKKIRDEYDSFSSAGSHLVDGFASGISTNSFKAAAKAAAMAEAAAQAAREALDINSPSKVFRSIGTSIPEGFAMGIDKMSGVVTDSSVTMARSAIDNVKSSVTRIADIVGSDIDTQPTIRPVLDLSDVRSGASSIGSLFDTNASVGVLAKVNSIGSMMNNRVQNGGNDDIISAIDKLRNDLANASHDTYQINGVTYDDGSNISDAVRSLVRAARVERRT